MGLNHAHVGEFGPALSAEAEAQSIGEAIGDRHLQSLAHWTTGIIVAFAQEGDAGVVACRRALDCSPDPFNTAITQGWLGYAYLEREETAQAIPLLEQAVEQLAQFRFPQFQAWLMAYLADARCLAGRFEVGRDLALRALGITRACGFAYGVGCAQRVLGRIARHQGGLAEAEAMLAEAARTFATVHARHEVARTQLDLAIVLHAEGRTRAAIPLLQGAHEVFGAVPAPRLAKRAQALADELGGAGGA
jgi:tetratricopeptide (TPR) repeat protein